MSLTEKIDIKPTDFRMSYRDVAMHKVMLQDVIRTDAYEKSIRETVKPEHTVLDFGTGTGILAIFAAKAGAKKVIAVDRSPFIKTAQQIALQNDINNISFYHDDHESLQLDEKVDVIVSEWMGHCLFYEAMLLPLLKVRDRFLVPGGKMIPAEVSLHAGLVCDKSVLEDLHFLKSRPYGVDFSPIANVPLQQSELANLYPEQILKSTVHLGSLNMESVSIKTMTTDSTVFTGKMKPNKKATIYALCGWFSTELSNGVRFATGPNDAPTHWDQIILPLSESFKVDPSVELTICISPLTEQVGKDQCWAWSISDGVKTLSNNEWEHRSHQGIDVPQGLLK